jgi:glutamate--cysteine ligase
VAYAGPDGIRALLDGIAAKDCWAPVLDRDAVIGLKGPKGQGAISLEPGGQFELSGAPVPTIHDTCRELHAHLAQLREIAEPLGIAFLALGMSPKWTRAETPAMPKARYRIMTRYMPKVGHYGLDMMYRTATVQVNLDYSSEADMVKKLRVSLALQPVATALFANSPFTEGKLNGYLSMRSEIWRDTDNQRAGMLPFAFEPGMGFDRYVDYALDVPMYFVKRGEVYHDVAGASFRDLMAGRLAQLPGETATVSDWANHLSTIFPEVRLKRYLEMRGADSGRTSRICALPALWVGLLYDDLSLDAAWEMVKDWTAEERQTLRDEVPRFGLSAAIRNRSVRDVARDVLELAREGLGRRGRVNELGDDETIFLATLDRIAEAGRTHAEDLIDRYRGPWCRSIDPVFFEEAY